MHSSIKWQSSDSKGLEVLFMQEASNSLAFISHVTGSDPDLHASWHASYRIICDTAWHTKEVEIIERTLQKTLHLKSDGVGNWWRDEQELTEFKGCIDIDYRATPFSNTLPIRRLNLGIGESAQIEVVYINAPDLALSREKQIYTRLAERTWRFEQPNAGFTAEITVDDEGFVVEYPGLFQRMR